MTMDNFGGVFCFESVAAAPNATAAATVAAFTTESGKTRPGAGLALLSQGKTGAESSSCFDAFIEA